MDVGNHTFSGLISVHVRVRLHVDSIDVTTCVESVKESVMFITLIATFLLYSFRFALLFIFFSFQMNCSFQHAHVRAHAVLIPLAQSDKFV